MTPNWKQIAGQIRNVVAISSGRSALARCPGCHKLLRLPLTPRQAFQNVLVRCRTDHQGCGRESRWAELDHSGA